MNPYIDHSDDDVDAEHHHVQMLTYAIFFVESCSSSHRMQSKAHSIMMFVNMSKCLE